MKQIYRTVFQVEVLSSEPWEEGTNDYDPFTLAEINYAITEGDCIGNVELVGGQVIRGEAAITDALLAIGNDGTFFEMWPDDEEVTE